jgi:ACT domain-containing protein
MAKQKEAVATAQLKHKLVQHLRDIPIATYACQRVGVPKATYYKWRKIDQIFREASDEAIITGKLTLNDVAKSQLVKLIKEGDYRSISFWLKHNDADFGSKLTLKIEDETRKYDPKDLEEMATAMKNAGLVGVTLAHQKMAEVFRRSQEKEEAHDAELATYQDDDDESTTEESEPKKPRKGGVKIADIAKKLEEKKKAKE